jgi:V/A-type H+-transporting ATPase subunit A
MGYHVALMADSTSRWAEALRELSGRLEEMPAEEGFPSYLSSRIGQFYERAGMVKNLNDTESSVTIIGAVSPPGGDFSEPVTQSTKRFVRCFWGLDKNLAYSRHYPSINWLTSYSEYAEDLKDWFDENVDKNWTDYRKKLAELLAQDDKLQQIIKIVGEDVLPDNQKLIVLVSKIVKIGILQQNAFSDTDSFCSLDKQFRMVKIILDIYEKAKTFINKSIPLSKVLPPQIVSDLMTMKEKITNISDFDSVEKSINESFTELEKTYK